MHVARLAQSVEHGTLSPRSWVRAQRWAKLLLARYHNILKERNY